MINPEVIDSFLERQLFDSQSYKDQGLDTINREISLLPVQLPIFQKLLHHQKVGLLLNIDREYFLDLFEMGLGKSITALATIQYLKQLNKINRTLILVPNTSLLESWKTEIEKFTPELTYTILDGDAEERENKLFNEKSDIAICTYASWMFSISNLTSIFDQKKKKLIVDYIKANIYESQFQCVVFDEITAAKSHRSTTFKICSRFRNRCQYRYGLAGRPYSVDQHDLWSIFNVIDGGETLGNTLGIFRDSLFSTKKGYFGGYEYKFDKKKTNTLNKFLRNRSIIYKKDECLDLPPKVYGIRKVIHTEDMYNNYNKIIKDIIGADGKIDQLDGAWHNLRQICSGWIRAKDHEGNPHDIIFNENPKLDSLMEFIDELPKDEKLIIFHHYETTGRILSKCFIKNKIKHEWLYGGHKDKDSVKIFTDFPDCRIFLGSSAASLGLNLQAAHYVVFFEEFVSPLIYNQSVDRAYRYGQNKTVFIYSFLVKGSIEEKIHYSLMSGEDLYSQITKNPQKIFSELGK